MVRWASDSASVTGRSWSMDEGRNCGCLTGVTGGAVEHGLLGFVRIVGLAVQGHLLDKKSVGRGDGCMGSCNSEDRLAGAMVRVVLMGRTGDTTIEVVDLGGVIVGLIWMSVLLSGWAGRGRVIKAGVAGTERSY